MKVYTSFGRASNARITSTPNGEFTITVGCERRVFNDAVFKCRGHKKALGIIEMLRANGYQIPYRVDTDIKNDYDEPLPESIDRLIEGSVMELRRKVDSRIAELTRSGLFKAKDLKVVTRSVEVSDEPNVFRLEVTIYIDTPPF